MNITNYFEYTYSLDSFLKTILFENYWGISDPVKFKKEQKKNYDAAVRELTSFASCSLSKQELITKLRAEQDHVAAAQNKLSKNTLNAHESILKQLLEKLSAELDTLLRDAFNLPIDGFTYVEVDTPLKKSTYKHPVRFFQSIMDISNIKYLKTKLYDFRGSDGFRIDEVAETCTDILDPDWVIKFSDELEKAVNDEKANSTGLISQYIFQHPKESEEYLKNIYRDLLMLLPRTNDIQIKKYPCIKKAINELKKHLEKTYPHHLNSVKTKTLASNEKNSSFIYLLKGRKSDNALSSFFRRLKKDGFVGKKTSLPNFKKVIKGKEYSERIMWLKGPESLRYMVNQLIVNWVVDYKGKNKWEVVCNSFIKGDLTEFDSKNLGKGHKPSNTENLDSICELLISATNKEK